MFIIGIIPPQGGAEASNLVSAVICRLRFSRLYASIQKSDRTL